MTKRTLILTILLLISMICLSNAQDKIIGGDLKLTLFDITTGTSRLADTASSTGYTDYDTTDRYSFGFNSFILYVTPQIGDYLSLDIEPEISAHTGATPRLGTRIGMQRPANVSEVDISLAVANVTYQAPGDFEIKAGILRPVFQVDYGEERFYQEQLNAYKPITNGYLGSWHDAGVEFYKSFDIKLSENSYASLPVSLYLLNGGFEVADNNNDKTILLHTAPEISNFKLIGSAALGKWDNANNENYMRYNVGLEANFKRLWLRSEYTAGKWDNKVAGGETLDYKPMGFYVKAGVNLIPDKLRLILNYNYAKFNWNSRGANEEIYTTIVGALNYFVAPGATLILAVDNADWKCDVEKTKITFLRLTLGSRIIF